MPLFALILLLGGALSALAQPISPPARESLVYNVEWRLISAGKARIEFLANPPSRPGYQLNLRLESTGLVSKLFRVQDDYSAQLSSALCIQASQLKALEGKRQRENKITFENGKAVYLERDVLKNTTVLSKEIDIPACVHDVAGGLYLMRTLNLEPGQSTQIPVSDGKKSVSARVEAQQREDVKTPAGTFKAMRYEVFLFNGVLYQRPAHLYVWISDDGNRLPVQLRVRMQFAIGTITLQLEKHE
jgi:hypothetical protein